MKVMYQEKYIRTQDGLRIFFRDYNQYNFDNIPIICLPGLTRNCKDFHNFAQLFSNSSRVISIDMRGRGKSEYDKNLKNYWKPDVYMTDIFSITSSLNIHKGIYLGTSLGGLMAMQVALIRPSSVSGIILNDIGPDLPVNGVMNIHKNLKNRLEFNNWNDAKNFYEKKYNSYHPNFSSEQWLEQTKNTFKEENNLIVSDYDIRIITGAVKTSQSNNLWELYSCINKIPTICLRGEFSDILMEDTFNKMKLEKKDLIQLIVKNCGHNPQLDEPEVIEELKKFFKFVNDSQINE